MIQTISVYSLAKKSSQTLYKKWIKLLSKKRKSMSTQEAKAWASHQLWERQPAFSFLLNRSLAKDQLKSQVIVVRNRLASMLQVAKVGPSAMLVRPIRLKSANINPSTTRLRKSLSKPTLLHLVKIMELTEFISEKFSILFGATRSSEISTSLYTAWSVQLKKLPETRLMRRVSMTRTMHWQETICFRWIYQRMVLSILPRHPQQLIEGSICWEMESLGLIQLQTRMEWKDASHAGLSATIQPYSHRMEMHRRRTHLIGRPFRNSKLSTGQSFLLRSTIVCSLWKTIILLRIGTLQPFTSRTIKWRDSWILRWRT